MIKRETKLDRQSILRMCLLLSAPLSCGALAAVAEIDAPNVVAISPSLVTSGQPTKHTLSHLAEWGFGAVIYLAPPTVEDAVPGEAEIVREQGLDFVNIPIKFSDPSDADLKSFIEAMDRFGDRKVLVHCQVNLRASSMTFLYRVIKGRELADQAYESVTQVWAPQAVWKKFIVSQLRKAGITFEPY